MINQIKKTNRPPFPLRYAVSQSLCTLWRLVSCGWSILVQDLEAISVNNGETE